MTGWLEVLATGPQTLVQDLGRPGYAAVGVTRSGAADRAAYRLGGRLVAHPEGLAALEVTLGGFSARAHGALTVCVTGAPAPLRIDDRVAGHAAVTSVGDGQLVELGAPPSGMRSYLTVRGGIEVDPVLGSRSTDTLSGLGPPPVLAGDRLLIGKQTAGVPNVDVAPVRLPPAGLLRLRVLPGPRLDWFAAPELLELTPWTVSDRSNRVGVRLEGVALARLGRIADAADHLAMDRLVQPLRPPVPEPFADRAAFHRALVAGIEADRTLTWEPAATTTRMGFQTRNLLRHETPEFLALRRLILGAVERYVAAGRGHPWLARFPQRVSVYAWATVLQSGGRQLAHIHPSAVVSGVYYVAVPEAVARGDTDGWIEFGRAPDLLHPPADTPVRRLQPEEGAMVLFPSWLYHRTFPFDSGERRISIAFDVMAG